MGDKGVRSPSGAISPNSLSPGYLRAQANSHSDDRCRVERTCSAGQFKSQDSASEALSVHRKMIEQVLCVSNVCVFLCVNVCVLVCSFSCGVLMPFSVRIFVLHFLIK